MADAMENDSSLNITAYESTLMLLPIGALAFAPFLLLQLVAAIVSNAILLALVILACVKKLNNNINIYLFSLAVGGLIGAFNILCVFTMIVARRWVLGLIPCYLARYGVISYSIFFNTLYLIMSQDKLKTIKDPFHGRPTNKRAYIRSAVIWIASTSSGLLIGLTTLRDVSSENDLQGFFMKQGYFVCFGLPNTRIISNFALIVTSAYVFGFFMTTTIAIAITLRNFARILQELRKLKKLRLRYVNESRKGRVIRINQLDKPLYRTGEERTAKSLALVYFIQVSCGLISLLMFNINIIRNFVLPPEMVDNVAKLEIYYILAVIIQFFPCVNPIFLIMSNKRLRIRVKELFKCTLNPEVEESPVHKMTSKKTTRVIMASKTNKITPLTKGQ